MSYCDCTANTTEFGEPSDGYGVSVRADRMRGRDSLIEALDALAQARHYLTEHEGTDFGRRIPNDRATAMLGTMTTILHMLTDEVERTI